jgi:hypothetical protein
MRGLFVSDGRAVRADTTPLRALAATQAVAALAIAPSALVLEAPGYLSIWAAWLIAGVVAWVTKHGRHTILVLAVIQTIILALAFLVIQ